MQQIALAQWAHDIRNALGTAALYVETLERPDPQSRKAVARTHALLAQAAAICNAAVRQVRSETVVRTVLAGGKAAATPKTPTGPGMPSFGWRSVQLAHGVRSETRQWPVMSARPRRTSLISVGRIGTLKRMLINS